MDHMWIFTDDQEPPDGCSEIEVMLEGKPREVWCSCDYWWDKSKGKELPVWWRFSYE